MKFSLGGKKEYPLQGGLLKSGCLLQEATETNKTT